MGTGTFVVVWTEVALCPCERSRSVTSGAQKAGLVLQIETLRFDPCTMSRSVTDRAGFTVQMLQIEKLKARAAKTTTMETGTFVVIALATAFPQIKLAKTNLSLFGRFSSMWSVWGRLLRAPQQLGRPPRRRPWPPTLREPRHCPPRAPPVPRAQRPSIPGAP